MLVGLGQLADERVGARVAGGVQDEGTLCAVGAGVSVVDVGGRVLHRRTPDA
jgi:hypothetical protein